MLTTSGIQPWPSSHSPLGLVISAVRRCPSVLFVPILAVVMGALHAPSKLFRVSHVASNTDPTPVRLFVPFVYMSKPLWPFRLFASPVCAGRCGSELCWATAHPALLNNSESTGRS